MGDQSSQLSRQIPTGQIPEKWREKFVIKRIEAEDIGISLEERNGILQALNRGDRFIQIGKYTLMLNAIKSIDPLWGPENVPPRPQPEYYHELIADGAVRTVVNQDEIDLWDKIFGEPKVKELEAESVDEISF